MGILFSRKKKEEKKSATGGHLEGERSALDLDKPPTAKATPGGEGTPQTPPTSPPIQCPPGCVTDPNYVPPPKDPKQEAKEKKEREKKAKEEEKRKKDEEKKAQEREKKRLEEERKAKEKAEKEKAAKEAKEAKEKAAKEAKEAKERAAKEAKEKKEAEAARKKREEEEKKQKTTPAAPQVGSQAGGDIPCPPGCIPDPALVKREPEPTPPPEPCPEPPPPVCPPGCMPDPNRLQKVNHEIPCPTNCKHEHENQLGMEPSVAAQPCPKSSPNSSQQPQQEIIIKIEPGSQRTPPSSAPETSAPPSTPCPTPPAVNPCPSATPFIPAQPHGAATYGWNPQPPYPPQGPHNCPTCEQTWPPGKEQPAVAGQQQMTSPYCHHHGYYLRQNFQARIPQPFPYVYGGMPEPVHVPDYQRQNHFYERPNTPYTGEHPNVGRPTTPYGVIVPADGSSCCHTPTMTRQVTHYGTRQCQFGQQNESEHDADIYEQGAIVPLTDRPTAIIPGGAVLYIGGHSSGKQQYRYARQRAPAIRVKHISLPKLPYISFQGIAMDEIQPKFYNESLDTDDTIRLLIKRKKQQRDSMLDSRQNYALMPGDVKNANFAIKSSDNFHIEEQNRMDYGGSFVHLDEDGKFTIRFKEMMTGPGGVVGGARNQQRSRTSTAMAALKGTLELVNFNVDDEGEKGESCDDKKNPQQETIEGDNNGEECEDDLEEILYDEDETEECEHELTQDLMLKNEDTEENCLDEVWQEEDDNDCSCAPIEENDDDAYEDDETTCLDSSTHPTLAFIDNAFKFELRESTEEPAKVINNYDDDNEVVDLSSTINGNLQFDPSDSSIDGDDGDPTLERPCSSKFNQRPTSADAVSSSSEQKPKILRFGSWVKNAILPDYKK